MCDKCDKKLTVDPNCPSVKIATVNTVNQIFVCLSCL